ncbi:DUF2239 family protein [Alteriqipengyuania sp. NZ-12B]|uniref:DUF2239 family protein n=1 Tax=Alteriqipengyuania abyssalis TaxID=2860200 RepID=A0ABS7PE10_9SPHN|nr:DUF2239 family protein [Alteriqipengyuania abyssalis]MBY8337323.1 DUF2239 family protein [Alteriqipengyuania abyssalis]
MTDFADIAATAFAGHNLLASGPLDLVALAVRKAEREGADGPLLVFDDASGRVIDLDLRGSEADVLARLADRGAAKPGPAQAQEKPRGRGRPKLGVVGREVTLLPRHWDWLEQQPASASQVIRRLIDAARREEGGDAVAAGPADPVHPVRATRPVPRRVRAERTYRVMTDLAGDQPGYEEALRALFVGDDAALAANIADWPGDVAAYVHRLAGLEEADG